MSVLGFSSASKRISQRPRSTGLQADSSLLVYHFKRQRKNPIPASKSNEALI
jgi:hypothetical protein